MQISMDSEEAAERLTQVIAGKSNNEKSNETTLEHNETDTSKRERTFEKFEEKKRGLDIWRMVDF